MDNATINKESALYKLLNQYPLGDNTSECLTCGACNSRCTWFDGEGGPLPRQIIRMAALGLDELLVNSDMLWDCLVCNRCTQVCPMGITMDKVVRKARSLAIADGKIPEDVKIGIKRRLETGDVNGLTTEEFVETVEWVSEEFVDEVDDPKAEIPHDIKGTKLLYLPNPRELGINLLHLTAMAKLFYATKETWTLSAHHTDVTNWGYFVGKDDITEKMALMVVEPAEKLGVETLVLSECGHGYHVLKYLLEDIIGRKPEFEVLSMPELIVRYAQKGVLKFDPGVHPYKIAYHDPCNIARKSGGYDAPRELLSMVCDGVVELIPNREDGICCGGGGGILQDSHSTPKRMITGKPKADQIKATGLQNLATACLSCHRQLGELSKHFKLGVTVDTVASLASEALIL
ncbi:MAG: (Fe-S)-binding protein [Desulfobacula sp.]|jgi:Fe-S oxidoreductase|uniref:(Fe-S)-binding protein n=3 Tax=Desulfobacula sp. TaxID=2593537 RepID=UPI001DD2BD4C|nr:(Fe-S)-binding protein [Desulfobacula sp.]MBT3485515.1 (Fe-S)-binding protein [Desulfobacula sp.]MBT3805332.1 (Fe-S)-binding protein [Desulfobacula sp.]MBT4025684.1 (Fe-S)-binding protein [Desulfobacula sp.]MBT4197503.1 (Fe-S)-binding protein [Desulfobacula sp.]